MPQDTILDFESAPVPARGLPTADHGEKKETFDDTIVAISPNAPDHGGEEMDAELIPSEEDMLTLRKVAAPLP